MKWWMFLEVSRHRSGRKKVTKEFYEKIIQTFDKILEERCVLIQTLIDGVTKFGRDEAMIDFYKEYKQMFNDAEFNLCGSFNDEDSEGDVDGDNNKNNNNDEKQDADKVENAEKEKVETEKEKRDKADKVDNVQEKQDDDKDGIDEGEFWNTQFTDIGCEELENKAKEEIKKMKTTKRKSNMEITPPSFSLGLSPDTNKIEERATKRAKNATSSLKQKKEMQPSGIICRH
uniref:Uncharacterized protein n=1 Tax=Tanacetum cinerariifolium TaxID=118510 RepID=A0A6L2JZ25_TANCI|nr:hypothetical protein [Tanacetum cinerariifolium]